MLAQVYDSRSEDGVIFMRIFDKNGLMLADVTLITLNEADDALKRLRMRRRERWDSTEWGKEAKIRFKL